jgi:hypothetical protein
MGQLRQRRSLADQQDFFSPVIAYNEWPRYPIILLYRLLLVEVWWSVSRILLIYTLKILFFRILLPCRLVNISHLICITCRPVDTALRSRRLRFFINFAVRTSDFIIIILITINNWRDFLISVAPITSNEIVSHHFRNTYNMKTQH